MRTDIEFSADGVTLRGWHYIPDSGDGPFATIIMAHGFSGVKEMDLDNYAEVFGLNSRQRNELVEYMRHWHILRLCCGKWMSHKWRMKLKLQPGGAKGEDFVDVRDPACSNYNMDEVERNFLRSVLYQRITKLGLGGVGKIIKVVGRLDGSYCSEYNQLVRLGE